MKVSVIIPNYNHALFLRKRIESVLNQTFNDFELIILDDCSKDDSKQIIEEYRGQKKITHIVYNSENSGSVFKQWEKGIRLAIGEYIWIAESDDYADPDFLKTLMNPISSNSEIVLAFTNSIKIDAFDTESDLLANDDFMSLHEKDALIDSFEFCEKQLLRTNNIPNASAVVFKKNEIVFSLLRKAQEYKLAGDWLFWFGLTNRKGLVYYHTFPYNKYRFHEQTVRFQGNRRNDTDHLIERFKVIEYNQAQLSLSLVEKKALQYGLIEKLIYLWKESRYIYKISAIRDALSIIDKIHPGSNWAFIKSFLKVYIKK